jgi:succinate dehydrogenase / fumarate reductase iron-sulfur subunit
MHPLDARDDRKEQAQKAQGIGYCNITKCCTEVCPEHIKITDNAIIPMKERVVDRKFDPIVRLGRKIFRRDQLDDPANWPSDEAPTHAPAMSGASVPGGREAAEAGVQAAPEQAWHHQARLPQAAPVGPDGHLPVSEIALDRPAASSPYGDDVTFPLPPENLNYRHE